MNAADHSSALGGQTARFSLIPGYEVVRRRRRTIATITDWMQAFLVYTAAVVSADSSMMLELLAYALTVIRASHNFDGLHWRAYDTHCRINAAASSNRSWSALDTDLYTRFFTGRARSAALCSQCDSSAHGEADCPHFDGLHWQAYDTHFRINAAASGNRSWSALDTDLYTRFFTGRARSAALCSQCDSSAHGEADCPHRLDPSRASRKSASSGADLVSSYRWLRQ